MILRSIRRFRRLGSPVHLRSVRRLARDRFEVRFERLKRELTPWRKQLFLDQSMLQVDPQLILESIRRVMPFCELHDGTGARLVWNEYKVFLAREDHDEFAHMEPRLLAEADRVLDGYRQALGAETIGDLTLRLLVDDGNAVEGRITVIHVAAKANQALNEYVAPPEEITVRLPASPAHAPREPAVVHLPPAPIEAQAVSTDRVANKVDNLTLRWDGGSAAVGPGVRWTVGRRIEPPPADYCIQLADASTRISTRAFWIEGKVDASGRVDGATIGRFDHDTANAVHINGELLGRGQEIRIFDFPTTIELTGGEFSLRLER